MTNHCVLKLEARARKRFNLETNICANLLFAFCLFVWGNEITFDCAYRERQQPHTKQMRDKSKSIGDCKFWILKRTDHREEDVENVWKIYLETQRVKNNNINSWLFVMNACVCARVRMWHWQLTVHSHSHIATYYTLHVDVDEVVEYVCMSVAEWCANSHQPYELRRRRSRWYTRTHTHSPKVK